MEEIIKNLKEGVQPTATANKDNTQDQQEQDDTTIIKTLRNLAEKETLDLPNFYRVVPIKNEMVRAKINHLAKQTLLANKGESLQFAQEEITDLYLLLETDASPSSADPESGEKYISYKDYKKLVAGQSEKTQSILTARTFIKLIDDPDGEGRVPINLLFSYIMRKVWLVETRASLSMYDDSGQGFLKEQGLENFITEIIPSLVQLNDVDESYAQYYVCTAVRKFFFFLDPNKSGRVRILDVLCSGMVDDLLDLREFTPPKPTNWFAFDNAMKAYGTYLNLDTDHNGLLSASELLHYGEGSMILTPAFVDRLFQECLTFSGEMDFRTYLDFVIAVEYPNEVQSLQYFFRILDIHGNGYLGSFALSYFYKDIQRYMMQTSGDRVPFDDVKDEMFDMVKPKDPFRITLQDLVKSGKGGLIVSILIDAKAFITYDNREVPEPKSRELQSYNSELGSEV